MASASQVFFGTHVSLPNLAGARQSNWSKQEVQPEFIWLALPVEHGRLLSVPDANRDIKGAGIDNRGEFEITGKVSDGHLHLIKKYLPLPQTTGTTRPIRYQGAYANKNFFGEYYLGDNTEEDGFFYLEDYKDSMVSRGTMLAIEQTLLSRVGRPQLSREYFSIQKPS